MDPANKTRRFDVAPCVMFVALAEEDARVCADLVKDLTASKPLSIMRVAHIRGACERMLVTRPMIVVFADVLRPADQVLLRERAEDIMAEVVVLPKTIVPVELEELLLFAVRQAYRKMV